MRRVPIVASGNYIIQNGDGDQISGLENVAQ